MFYFVFKLLRVKLKLKTNNSNECYLFTKDIKPNVFEISIFKNNLYKYLFIFIKNWQKA